MDHYTLLWILWLAGFFAIEIPALVKHRGHGFTLSEHVWSWFAITWPSDKPKPHFWRIRRVFLIALMGWLCLHFFTGGQF